MAKVRSLSIHADYRCRHSGHCCSTNWDVPVELRIDRSLTDALASGRLKMASGTEGLSPFILGSDLPEEAAAMFERTDDGRCVFLERSSHLCIVHRDLGESALAATCRHFPRVAIHDRRGTFVTLSHFCPTAASMLFRDDVPVQIVEEPPAFPPADYEGLEVTDEDLPPLLHPHMLMDLDGYSAWERHMVQRCADISRRPESILATLRRDAAIVAQWKPGAATLSEAVSELPPDFLEAPPETRLAASLELFHEAMTAVPEQFRPDPDEDGLAEAYASWVRAEWPGFRAPVNRYIAAKAFASWTAYQGRGVATIVRGIEAAVALVRVEAARRCRDAGKPLDADLLLEAFRSADFTLNHLAVGEDLAENWSRIEHSYRPNTAITGP
jgi:Fe-S-cluster containining protein